MTKNEKNIMKLVAEFRAWNIQWEGYTGVGTKPEDAVKFVERLSKEWEVLKSSRFEELRKDADWLRCLEAAGVDNWEGYDMAIDIRDGDV